MSERTRVPVAAGLLLLALAIGCSRDGNGPEQEASADAPPPNIVVILADDLGYADVSTYGDRLQTPNIDRIGREGAVFTQGYVTTPVCSPSRAALLTGRYQQRFGFEYNARQAPEVPDVGLIPGELTIADLLKAAGYATGIVGKWHLGFKDEHYPTNRGFDEFYGHLSGATRFINRRTQGAVSMSADEEFRRRPPEDPRTDLVVRGTEPPAPPTRRAGNLIVRGPEKTVVDEPAYITDVFGDESVDFIRRHADGPFFLYSAFNAPHSPFQVTEEYYNRFPDVEHELQRIYFGMIAALDDAVGRILDALDEAGVADKTLVVFLSDNGCAGYFPGLCSCEPLSGGKLTYYEGGVRVPYLLRWPAAVAAGTTIDAPVSTLDILPTALAAAGASAPADLELDGHDLMPLLDGSAEATGDGRFVWRNYPTVAARSGDMKLIKPHQDEPGGFLYDLSADVREQTDLATERPEDVADLEAVIEDWRSITVEPAWTRRGPVAYSICNIEPIGFEN
ncbi:MAG: sulfatase-like hydrolase/transferase [Acidobacteriota bacterium]|nr:sulfatase-like hydrolase/transferase [Acidobacteriota bacterium]MDE3265601.1 sulfatase-like hydrolase/transferase [Acidobacteriota bacterium]